MLTPSQRIKASIDALKRKKLLPEHTLGYFDTDPASLRKLTAITAKQVFKEWTCDICLISVYGPKKLLLEHHKIHSQKRDLGENEIYQRNYHLFR